MLSFRLDRPAWIVVSFVLTFHAVMLLCLCWNYRAAPLVLKKTVPHRFVVQTVDIAPSRDIASSRIQEAPKKMEKQVQPVASSQKKLETAKKPVKQEKVEPVKKTIKQEKVEPAKKPVKAVPVEKKPSQPPQEEQARQQKLLAAAKESMAKVGQHRDKEILTKEKQAELATPKAITSLQLDSLPPSQDNMALSTQEVGYREELASRLKLWLKLPEYGDVKIKLTLQKTGKVHSLEVIQTESVANKNYVEKVVPTLTFPPFGQNLKVDHYTFAITLSNE